MSRCGRVLVPSVGHSSGHTFQKCFVSSYPATRHSLNPNPDPREYYFSLWQCHAVNPKWDCRQFPLAHDDETTASTAWSLFRQSQATTRKEEDAEHDDYCDRNGVGTASPGSSDNDVDQSKEVGETQAVTCELRELLPGSKTAPWTLQSRDGLFECVVHDTKDEDEEDAGRA